jgi:4a-hydroxytetrahydrobiopterin dehydratase
MPPVADDLRALGCRPGAKRLAPAEVQQRLAAIPGWSLAENGIERSFYFDSYAKTVAFVNAVARLAEAEDHHPDMHVSHRRCTLRFTTHSAGGLTLNDFICAARVDALEA